MNKDNSSSEWSYIFNAQGLIKIIVRINLWNEKQNPPEVYNMGWDTVTCNTSSRLTTNLVPIQSLPLINPPDAFPQRSEKWKLSVQWYNENQCIYSPLKEAGKERTWASTPLGNCLKVHWFFSLDAVDHCSISQSHQHSVHYLHFSLSIMLSRASVLHKALGVRFITHALLDQWSYAITSLIGYP